MHLPSLPPWAARRPVGSPSPSLPTRGAQRRRGQRWWDICLLASVQATWVQRGLRSQCRHAVGASVPRQAQSELSAHVVGHEPAGHEVVAPREAASAALGRGQRYQHVRSQPIFSAGLRIPA